MRVNVMNIDTRRAASTFPLLVAALIAAAFAAACEGCSDAPPAGDDAGPVQACVVDADCDADLVCAGGACAVPLARDGGALPIDEDGGSVVGDGGSQADGGPQAGTLSVLPGTLIEFGAQRIGVPVQRIVTLVNVGDVPITVRQLVLDDNEAATFTATPIGDVEEILAPQDSLAITVVHTPDDGQPNNARLLVLHTGLSGLLAIDLFAEFKGVSILSATGAPGIPLTTITEVDLGDVPVGSSRSAKVYVRNAGASDSILGLAGLTVTPNTVGFTAVHAPLTQPVYLEPFDALCPIGLTDCPGTASACVGGACVDAMGAPLGAFVATVTFLATTVGAAQATLTLQSDEGGVASAQTNITLKATAVAGDVVISPSPVELGEVYTGREATAPITIANAGGAPVTISALTVTGTTFTITHALVLPYELGAGESVDAVVHFTSASAGDYLRVLTVDTDATTDATVDLHAVAVDPGSAVVLDDTVNPFAADPAIAFGDRYVGFAYEAPVYVANLGPGDLRITRLTIEGDDAALYSVFPGTFDDPIQEAFNTNNANPDVRYQPRFELTVRYTPAALTNSVDTATLVLETDDPDQPVLEVELSGRAVQPTIVVSPTSIDFGPVLVDAPPPTRQVEVHNDGFGTLRITAITQPAASEFVVVPAQPLPFDLSPTDPPLILNVTFDPTTSTNASSSFSIASSDVLNDDVVVTLGGGGDTCNVLPGTVNPPDQTDNTCVYQCLSTFHECGDDGEGDCRANSSPDSCGTSCTPCNVRSNTTRGCVSSTGACTYSCTTQHYDLNNDRSVAQGSFSNGCEYTCPVATPTAETCDDLDNDCDGTADDNLPLEVNEPADTCTSGTVDLGDVNDNDDNGVTVTGYMIYPAGDEDWFKIRAHEEETNFCVGDEDYQTTFRLKNIHRGTGTLANDFDLQVREDSCSGTTFQSVNAGTANEEIILNWGGGCGGNDNKTFYIRVFPYRGNSCDPYLLEVIHNRL